MADGFVSLIWNRNLETNISYRVHYGTNSRAYFASKAVGQATNATISGLQPGIDYYFAATATDRNCLESDFSNEVITQLASQPAREIAQNPVLSQVSYNQEPEYPGCVPTFLLHFSFRAQPGNRYQVQRKIGTNPWETLQTYFVYQTNSIPITFTHKYPALGVPQMEWFRVEIKP